MDTCAWCGKPYRRSPISRWPHCSRKCKAEHDAHDADSNERRDRRRERRAAESSQYDAEREADVEWIDDDWYIQLAAQSAAIDAARRREEDAARRREEDAAARYAARRREEDAAERRQRQLNRQFRREMALEEWVGFARGLVGYLSKHAATVVCLPTWLLLGIRGKRPKRCRSLKHFRSLLTGVHADPIIRTGTLAGILAATILLAAILLAVTTVVKALFCASLFLSLVSNAAILLAARIAARRRRPAKGG